MKDEVTPLGCHRKPKKRNGGRYRIRIRTITQLQQLTTQQTARFTFFSMWRNSNGM